MSQVGDKIVDFILKDQKDKDFNSAEYRGKKLLLSFHPLAFTPVCANQMKALEQHYDTMKELNAVPVGISIDHAFAKAAWAKELGLTKLEILADFWPHGRLAEQLGIFRDANGFSERANIILDEEGTIIWKKVYPIPELPDIDEVLEKLK